MGRCLIRGMTGTHKLESQTAGRQIGFGYSTSIITKTGLLASIYMPLGHYRKLPLALSQTSSSFSSDQPRGLEHALLHSKEDSWTWEYSTANLTWAGALNSNYGKINHMKTIVTITSWSRYSSNCKNSKSSVYTWLCTYMYCMHSHLADEIQF